MKWVPCYVASLLVAAGCTNGKTDKSPQPPTDRSARMETGFVTRIDDAKGDGKSKYVVFVPHDYDGTRPYPAILFLHGRSQSGDDGVKPVTGGLAEAIRKREHTFPFITIFPQSREQTWEAHSVDGKRAISVLDDVEHAYLVDRDRVYLTGYSMGGAGTFSLAAAHPGRWAAIIPICGSGDPGLAEKVKDIPCWCFVGDADAPNVVSNVRKMMSAIKQAGGRPLYHEYPGVGHHCFDQTYANVDVFEWLLLHQRHEE